MGKVLKFPEQREKQVRYCSESGEFDNADVLRCYGAWPAPTMIHVDGPYGIGGFPGDPISYDELPEVYLPHIAAWTKAARPSTTLWFWGTELGWATMHPYLDKAGWDYQELNVWNKGLSHIAGNVNSKTIRGVPVVTEVCARYTRRVRLTSPQGEKLSIKDWVRKEWERSGVPLYRANEACGVKNAATRKYLTKDDLWYFPPASMMEKMARYLEEHGRETEWPYFSLNGKTRLTACQWESLRSKWNHIHGVTNVWDVPALNGKERIRVAGGRKALHLNQKPLHIMKYILGTTTDEGDVVWDPFGGLASMFVCAAQGNRCCYSAESNSEVYAKAVDRIERCVGKDSKSEGGEALCMMTS